MTKIVLLCSNGMSTSLLVTKMREAAAEQGMDCMIDAFSVAEASKVSVDADAVLIGPQIRFQLAGLQKSLPCPVECIDMQAYGTMDGAAVIAQVKKMLGEQHG